LLLTKESEVNRTLLTELNEFDIAPPFVVSCDETDWQDCYYWTSINEVVRRRRVTDLPARGNKSIVTPPVKHPLAPWYNDRARRTWKSMPKMIKFYIWGNCLQLKRVKSMLRAGLAGSREKEDKRTNMQK